MFQLDFTSRVPIYEQLYQNVIKLASAGALKPGDRLPPVRQLASELGINPNTAAKAYRNLESDGYIYTSVGRGSFITDALDTSAAQRLGAVEKFKASASEAIRLGFTMDELVAIIKNLCKGGTGID